MIERSFQVLTNLPARVKTALGAIGITVYGPLAVALEETKDIISKIPAAGNFYRELFEIPPQELLKTGSAMLATLCICAMYDGVKKNDCRKKSK